MPRIKLPYQYAPRSYHRRIYAALERGVKHLCLVMHRRSGKTESLLAYLPIPMLSRTGNYAHVFPLLQQAREVVWDGIGQHTGFRYIEHFPAPLLAIPPNKSELRITLKHAQQQALRGSTYQLKGTDRNVNALVGGGTVGIVWDEYSLQNPMARDYARPILAENQGWEVAAFTPRGENHAYELYQYAQNSSDWQTEYLTVEDTRRDGPGEDGSPVVTPEAIEAHRKELLARGVDDADAVIDQEYYLAWHTPMPGAYYATEMRWLESMGRITTVPYDPSLPTYTAWDLGINDLNAIWFFQPAGNEVRFIDYLQGASIPLAQPDYLHQVDNRGENWIDLVRAKPYTYDQSQLPQPTTRETYEVHYGPHDLENHEYSSNKTRYGIALERGLRFTVLPHPGPGGLADGIAAARRLLRRSVFDRERCKLGLSALRSFRREWDDLKRTYSNTPVHDWASNGAAAFRYAAVGLGNVPLAIDTQAPPNSFNYWRKQMKRQRQGLPVATFRVGG